MAIRAALAVAVPEVYQAQLERAGDAGLPEAEQVAALSLLAESGQPDCVAIAARRLEPSSSEAVQLAAVRVLDRFSGSADPALWLPRLPGFSETIQRAMVASWLGRRPSAEFLLDEVDRGRFPATAIPLETLRVVATHGDPRLDAIVRKHWGRIQSGTPEEKLAIMRRLNNYLRAASGNPQTGKLLFQKHCAVCHQLFGSGEKVGPDLTNTSRKDLEFLLANLVDPSAVVKREFLATTLVLNDGRILTGLVVADTGGEWTLVDSQGKKQQVVKGAVEEDHPAETSLMPEGLVLQLQPQELRDLIRYLQSDP